MKTHGRPPTARSAMHYQHIELGAEMTESEGWARPSRYADPEEEAARVLRSVGIADISPAGKLRLQGETVGPAIRRALPDRQDTAPGSAFVASSHLARLVVAHLAPDDYLIVADASRTDHIRRRLELSGCAHVVDVTSVLAAVRITGPESPNVLSGVTDLHLAPHYFPNLACAQGMVAEIHGTVIRRDMGEHLSYDVLFGRDYGEYLWESLREAGRPAGLTPFGLEAMTLLYR